MAEFKDYFSAHSVDYAKFRPHYPVNLFKYLAGIAPDTRNALDCAAGSGQAAFGLKGFFEKVTAFDASRNQVKNRMCAGEISFIVCKAENLCFAENSIDLITVAQALHWIDLDRFYPELKRVLKKHGVFAVWTYNLPRYNDALNAAIDSFYYDIVGKYWSPERKHIEDNYATIEFPFERLESPDFEMTTEWTADHLLGYISTWSAVRKFLTEECRDPMPHIIESVTDIWKSLPKTLTFTWPLTLLVSRNPY